MRVWVRHLLECRDPIFPVLGRIQVLQSSAQAQVDAALEAVAVLQIFFLWLAGGFARGLGLKGNVNHRKIDACSQGPSFVRLSCSCFSAFFLAFSSALAFASASWRGKASSVRHSKDYYSCPHSFFSRLRSAAGSLSAFSASAMTPALTAGRPLLLEPKGCAVSTLSKQREGKVALRVSANRRMETAEERRCK